MGPGTGACVVELVSAGLGLRRCGGLASFYPSNENANSNFVCNNRDRAR